MKVGQLEIVPVLDGSARLLESLAAAGVEPADVTGLAFGRLLSGTGWRQWAFG